MFSQLIKEWTEQAELHQGETRNTFLICADQLEVALKAQQSEKTDKRSATSNSNLSEC